MSQYGLITILELCKEIEILSKYHALKVEIAKLWKTLTEFIPMAVGASVL